MKTVLIADDDHDLRETLAEALEDAGYRVVQAANGEEALARFDADPADLVITDMLMPKTEGFETVFELKRRYKLRNIVAMSGGGRSGNSDILRAAQEMGIRRVFQKPIDLTELVDFVDDLFNAKKGR